MSLNPTFVLRRYCEIVISVILLMIMMLMFAIGFYAAATGMRPWGTPVEDAERQQNFLMGRALENPNVDNAVIALASTLCC